MKRLSLDDLGSKDIRIGQKVEIRVPTSDLAENLYPYF